MPPIEITFKDMVEDLGERVGYVFAPDTFVTVTEAKRLLNQGILDFVTKTEVLTSRGTLHVVTGQAEYGLGEVKDFLKISKNGGVVYKDNPLRGKTIRWADRWTPNWRKGEAGTVEYYVSYQIRGIEHLCLIKAPSESKEWAITLWYVQKPEVLVLDGDKIESAISEWWELPVLYALKRIKTKEGIVNATRLATTEYNSGLRQVMVQRRAAKGDLEWLVSLR